MERVKELAIRVLSDPFKVVLITKAIALGLILFNILEGDEIESDQI